MDVHMKAKLSENWLKVHICTSFLKSLFVRTYVRTYVRPSVHKKFLRFQWKNVMHDGMQYDPIQSQGQVGNLAISKSYLHHLQWQLATDHGFSN